MPGFLILNMIKFYEKPEIVRATNQALFDIILKINQAYERVESYQQKKFNSLDP